ncbi:MAG: asparagine synthase (glutamine-hydrolyzing) [Helicobacteraceae bacterium]|nr:asparagine synthase (glutamine-hydrolyzing) [Helicobacteraceae bacterium]
MCGIAGFINTKNGSLEVLKKMQAEIYHRGPDEQRSLEFNQAFIGFNRLSIIDLSSASMQPIYHEESKIVLSFNGEIYNFLELKEDLLEKGYTFNSEGDAEVLLKTYLEYGLDTTLEKINGMFAISIYHIKEDRLILARDRMGKKPLYYQHIDNSVIYASELNALKKHPNFISELEPTSAQRYLIFGGVPAPYTMYKNTKKLEAGTYLVYENSSITIKKYWELSFKNRDTSISREEAYETFHKLLNSSFDIRKYADVPKALYLSGGIDSTIIAKLFNDQNLKIDSITSTFENKKSNEEKYAQEVINRYGFNSKKINIELDQDELFALMSKMDEPFADSAILPTMQMSKLVKELGYKVVFTGDGGDELLGGYHSRRDYSPLFTVPFNHLSKYNIHKGSWSSLKYLNPKYKSIYGFMKHRLKSVERESYLNIIDETLEPFINNSTTFLEFKQLYTIFNMQNFYNYKVDRATMAYSIEARSPLQDYRLFDYIFKIPTSFYASPKKKGKQFLKEILEEDFDKSFIYRKKQGFGMPIGDYIDKLDVQKYVKLSSDYLGVDFDKTLENESKYYYLTLGLWLEKNS